MCGTQQEQGQSAIVVYLNYVIYTASCCRKLKYTYWAEFEEEGLDKNSLRKVITWQHPANCMFIGAVAKPNDERELEWKIHQTRILQRRRAVHTSFNQCLTMLVHLSTTYSRLANGATFTLTLTPRLVTWIRLLPPNLNMMKIFCWRSETGHSTEGEMQGRNYVQMRILLKMNESLQRMISI